MAEEKNFAAPMKSRTGVYICRDCKVPLVEEGAFGWGRSARQVMLHALVGAVAVGILSPIFFLVRMVIVNGFAEAGLVPILLLVLAKIGVGLVIGAIVGTLAGVFGPDTGLVLGAMVGVLGAFFMAANKFAPISAAPAKRWDVVITSLAGGIILAALALFIDWLVMTRFRLSMVYEPEEEKR